MSERRGRKIIEREIEKEFFDIGFGQDDKTAWKQAEKARKKIKVQIRKDEYVADREHQDRDAAVEENVKRLLRVSESKIDSGFEKVRHPIPIVIIHLLTRSLNEICIVFSRPSSTTTERRRGRFSDGRTPPRERKRGGRKTRVAAACSRKRTLRPSENS